MGQGAQKLKWDIQVVMVPLVSDTKKREELRDSKNRNSRFEALRDGMEKQAKTDTMRTVNKINPSSRKRFWERVDFEKKLPVGCRVTHVPYCTCLIHQFKIWVL